MLALHTQIDEAMLALHTQIDEAMLALHTQIDEANLESLSSSNSTLTARKRSPQSAAA
jgi:hypothetical protein